MNPTRVRYLVLATLCAAAAVAYIHRSCLAVPASSMERDLELTRPQMAQIMSAFFLGYTLFQIPGGWLGDRLGTRLALTLFILIWSLATGLMGVARSPELLYLLWFINGVGQAGIFPCTVKSFTCWFPESERAMPSGLLGSFMSVGAATASVVAAVLLEFLDWPALFLVLAAPGVLFAIAFYAWFRDNPREHSWVNERELEIIESGNMNRTSQKNDSSIEFWKGMLSRSTLYLICGQQFFRAAAYVFYTTWFPTYLQEQHDVSVQQSGLLSSMPLFGVIVGSTLGGMLIDRIWRRTGSQNLSRRGVGLAAVLAAGLFLVLADSMSELVPAVGCITASGFFGGMSGPAGYTTSIDLAGNRVATVFSVMNFTGNGGAYLSPLIFGELDQPYWLLFLAGIYGGAALMWGLLYITGGEGKS